MAEPTKDLKLVWKVAGVFNVIIFRNSVSRNQRRPLCHFDMRRRLLKRLRKLMRNEVHAELSVSSNDTELLHAFLQSLSNVSDEEFRELIVRASVLDIFGDSQ